MDNKVKMINATTGSEMWVAEDRVKEYEAVGHKLASAPAAKKAPAKSKKKSK